MPGAAAGAGSPDRWTGPAGPPALGPRDGHTDETVAAATDVKATPLELNCCPFRLTCSPWTPAAEKDGTVQCTVVGLGGNGPSAVVTASA